MAGVTERGIKTPTTPSPEPSGDGGTFNDSDYFNVRPNPDSGPSGPQTPAHPPTQYKNQPYPIMELMTRPFGAFTKLGSQAGTTGADNTTVVTTTVVVLAGAFLLGLI